MFEDASDDPRRNVGAVDDQPDIVVRYAPPVIGLGRVENGEVERPTLFLPAVEDRSGKHVVEQPPKAWSAGARHTSESCVGGRSDGDVVRVAGDPVGPEGRYHIWGLLTEDGFNAVSQLRGGHIGYPAVGISEPVVAIGFATNGTPRSRTLGATNLAQRLPGGRETRADLAGLAIGCMNQNETELRVAGVLRDGARPGEGIVVRVRDYQRKRAARVHETIVTPQSRASHRAADRSQTS